MTIPTRLLALGATLTLGLAACGQDPTTPDQAAPGEQQPAGDEVVVEGFRFSPQQLEVTTGTTVVWRNNDGINHTATAGQPDAVDGNFDVEMPEAGTSGEHTFDEPGTYAYFCRFHESMTGEIIVTG